MSDIKVKNSWVIGFNNMRNLLNTPAEDGKERIIVGNTAKYAISRTHNLLTTELKTLSDAGKETQEAVNALKETLKTRETDPVAEDDLEDNEEVVALVKKHGEEWDTMMDTEIDIKVHKFHLEKLPENCMLPEMFMTVLEKMMFEESETTEPAAKPVKPKNN
jgi:hypothetical protein